MKNLYDKTYRQTLIERYLDAETSIQEEKALADFYRHCKPEDLTEEELGIRNLMLGLENYTQNSSSEDSDIAFDDKTLTASKTAARNQSSWASSIRLSAILLAAAMIAGLIFLVFPVKDLFSSKPTLASLTPTTQVIRSYQSSNDDSNERLNPAEEMERQDSLFLATTKDLVVQHTNEKARKEPKILHHIKNKKTPAQEESKSTASEQEEESLNDDFNHYYEVASLALPSADQLKIDKQGDNIIVTTTDEEGNMQHFTINTSDASEGMYQLQPLAQLNE